MSTARNKYARAVGARLAQIIPVVILATVVVFGLLQLLPGDPAAAIAGENATLERIAELRRQLGLDQPLVLQYWTWLSHALHGDLSKSLISGQDVLPFVMHILPNTLSVVFGAMLISLVIGIPLGIFSASRAQTVVDNGITSFVSLGMALPHFWAGMILVSIFALQYSLVPATGGITDSTDFLDACRHVVLPSLALALGGIPEVTRQLRSALLGELSSQHVRTLHAKGLSGLSILWKHCLKNVAVTLTTVTGLLFNRLLGATVAIEIVFAIPGIGSAIVNAALQKDLPVIQGIMAILVILVIAANILVDVICALIDPRIGK
jgi:peptide/nickel transport system permease protein